jgi:hypothetical protein
MIQNAREKKNKNATRRVIVIEFTNRGRGAWGGLGWYEVFDWMRSKRVCDYKDCVSDDASENRS